MEATLVIVTLLSLALAIGMAIVTWRLLQEERQRTDARVAALEEGLAASLAANPPAPAGTSTLTSTATPSAVASASGSGSGAAAAAVPAASAHAEPGETRPVMRTAARASEASESTERAERAEIVDLHGVDEPDWLAQFPASAAKVNGWHGTNGTKHNGTIASAIHVSSAPNSAEDSAASTAPTQPIVLLPPN